MVIVSVSPTRCPCERRPGLVHRCRNQASGGEELVFTAAAHQIERRYSGRWRPSKRCRSQECPARPAMPRSIRRSPRAIRSVVVPDPQQNAHRRRNRDRKRIRPQDAERRRRRRDRTPAVATNHHVTNRHKELRQAGVLHHTAAAASERSSEIHAACSERDNRDAERPNGAAPSTQSCGSRPNNLHKGFGRPAATTTGSTATPASIGAQA